MQTSSVLKDLAPRAYFAVASRKPKEADLGQRRRESHASNPTILKIRQGVVGDFTSFAANTYPVSFLTTGSSAAVIA